MIKTFHEYLSDRLSKEQPPSAGDLDDNQSNADRNFGKSGVKSKNVAKSVPETLSGLNPDKLFGKKRCKK